MVKIYSKPNCMRCELAKKYLLNKGIEFEEIDVFENEKALQMLRDEGRSEMPVVDIEDERHTGFRPEILAKAVK